MNPPYRPIMKRLSLVAIFACVLLTACGGGASSSLPTAQATPSPTPVPGTIPAAIVSGGRFVANGSHGVTFTFAVGPGVPAGEAGVVTALPTVAPCVGTGCTAVQPPLDGFTLSVGPQPLPVPDFSSVSLAGVQSPFALSMVLLDTTDIGAFTNFLYMTPTGGPILIIDPASARPVTTLVPNRAYAISIYTLPFVP